MEKDKFCEAIQDVVYRVGESRGSYKITCFKCRKTKRIASPNDCALFSKYVAKDFVRPLHSIFSQIPANCQEFIKNKHKHALCPKFCPDCKKQGNPGGGECLLCAWMNEK